MLEIYCFMYVNLILFHFAFPILFVYFHANTDISAGEKINTDCKNCQRGRIVILSTIVPNESDR
jgi:hypothetical protein